MSSLGVSVSASNFSSTYEAYIFYSPIKKIEIISEKLNLIVSLMALILSIIQTIWKNKQIDQFLAKMNEAYSSEKFKIIQICYRQQTTSCYRYGQRFSHIPHPNRLMLFVVAIHFHVLILIVINTLFTQQTQLINDCSSFIYPYRILQCEDKKDPCQFNNTNTAPKCTYYNFQLINLITMITSIVSWHYALRYFVIKLVRFIRWIMFCDNDRPRKFCLLRFSMRFNYAFSWFHLSTSIVFGFFRNTNDSHSPKGLLGPVWTPVFIAVNRLLSLPIALAPEFIQNWLDVASNDKITKELFFTNVEPLHYLTDKPAKTIHLYQNNIGTYV